MTPGKVEPRRPTRLAAERAEYLKRCEPIKEEIGNIYHAARDEGLLVGALKLLVERRQVEREVLQELARAEDPEAALCDYFRYKAEAEEADRARALEE